MIRPRRLFLAIVATISMAMLSAPVPAQTAPTEAMKAEMAAAWTAAAKTATAGPADVTLAEQAKIRIAADQVFIPAAEANKIMVALGNPVQSARQGLIISKDEKAPWLVDISWVKEGYVRDGDAKEWKADALLDTLKEGTEQANGERTERGYAALDVTGWVEQPRYDPATNRLIWSLALRERGAPANLPQTINYNTYALGREGYFSLDLITGSDSIASDKHVAEALLSSLNYVPGKRYADFDESTDQVAAYGIGALVGIAAAKKLGLLAVIGLFLVKAWKLVLVGVLAVGAIVRRIIGRRRADEEEDAVPAEVAEETADQAAEATAEPVVEAEEASEAVPLGKPDSAPRSDG